MVLFMEGKEGKQDFADDIRDKILSNVESLIDAMLEGPLEHKRKNPGNQYLKGYINALRVLRVNIGEIRK